MSKDNQHLNINTNSEEKNINNSNNKEYNQNYNIQPSSNKNNSQNKEELINDKINKPNEFRNFNAIPHFKENILNFNKNCSEPVKDFSYYCFSCKHSVCNECGVYEHKDHLLVQRDNCLNYDSSLFNEISKVIEKGINIDNKKIQIKNKISKSINDLKEELDMIEKEK